MSRTNRRPLFIALLAFFMLLAAPAAFAQAPVVITTPTPTHAAAVSPIQNEVPVTDNLKLEDGAMSGRLPQTIEIWVIRQLSCQDGCLIVESEKIVELDGMAPSEWLDEHINFDGALRLVHMRIWQGKLQIKWCPGIAGFPPVGQWNVNFDAIRTTLRGRTITVHVNVSYSCLVPTAEPPTVVPPTVVPPTPGVTPTATPKPLQPMTVIVNVTISRDMENGWPADRFVDWYDEPFEGAALALATKTWDGKTPKMEFFSAITNEKGRAIFMNLPVEWGKEHQRYWYAVMFDPPAGYQVIFGGNPVFMANPDGYLELNITLQELPEEDLGN